MSDEPAGIDRDYLFQERRNSMQRTAQIEDLLGIPRSAVPKKWRKPWRKFQEEHRGTVLDDYPEDDLDVTEDGPN